MSDDDEARPRAEAGEQATRHVIADDNGESSSEEDLRSTSSSSTHKEKARAGSRNSSSSSDEPSTPSSSSTAAERTRQQRGAVKERIRFLAEECKVLEERNTELKAKRRKLAAVADEQSYMQPQHSLTRMAGMEQLSARWAAAGPQQPMVGPQVAEGIRQAQHLAASQFASSMPPPYGSLPMQQHGNYFYYEQNAHRQLGEEQQAQNALLTAMRELRGEQRPNGHAPEPPPARQAPPDSPPLNAEEQQQAAAHLLENYYNINNKGRPKEG